MTHRIDASLRKGASPPGSAGDLRARAPAWELSALLAAFGALLGCGGEAASVSPLAVDTGSDAGAQPVPTGEPEPPPPPGPPPVDAGPLVRTVFTRNPFGGPIGNLLADGDFELSVVPEGGAGQYGWRAFNGNGTAERTFFAETGGLCRTGLRCAVLEPSMLLFGRGTAAAGGAGHVATMWAKLPPETTCDVVSVIAVECDTFITLKKLTPAGPDAEGFCELAATIPPRQTAVCLYVDSNLTGEQRVLLDSAAIVPDDGTISPRSGEIWVPPPETAERLRAVRRTIRDRTFFGRPPIPAVVE